jgi:hypothetical protein
VVLADGFYLPRRAEDEDIERGGSQLLPWAMIGHTSRFREWLSREADNTIIV